VSCGVGVSVRMAPKHCRKKDDTRLCYIRPCGKVLYSNSVSEWKCCPSFENEINRRMILENDTFVSELMRAFFSSN
jgi:hypothetical protein